MVPVEWAPDSPDDQQKENGVGIGAGVGAKWTEQGRQPKAQSPQGWRAGARPGQAHEALGT